MIGGKTDISDVEYSDRTDTKRQSTEGRKRTKRGYLPKVTNQAAAWAPLEEESRSSGSLRGRSSEVEGVEPNILGQQ